MSNELQPTRREALITTLSSLPVLGAASSLAVGQEPFKPIIGPPTKKIFGWAERGASDFEVGGTPLKLKLDPSQTRVGLRSFPVEKALVPRLGETAVAKCVVSSISDRNSVGAIRSALEVADISKELRQKTAYHFVRTGRRVVDLKKRGSLTDALVIGNDQHKTADEGGLVVGLGLENKSAVLTVLLPGDDGVYTFHGLTGKKNGPPTTATFHALRKKPKAPKRFGACFANCVMKSPGWLGEVVSGICTGCVAVILALPATAGLDSPIVIATCGACFVAMGFVVTICAIKCGL